MRASEVRKILTDWNLRPNNRECQLYASHSAQADHLLTHKEWLPLRRQYGLNGVRVPRRRQEDDGSWDFQDGPGYNPFVREW